MYTQVDGLYTQRQEENARNEEKQFAFVVGPCTHTSKFSSLSSSYASEWGGGERRRPSFTSSQLIYWYTEHTVLSNSMSIISREREEKNRRRRKGENYKLLFTSTEEKKSCCISQGLVNLINSLFLILSFPPIFHRSYTSILNLSLLYLSLNCV